MGRSRTDIFFIVFGLLDLYAFYRSSRLLILTFEDYKPDLYTILKVLVVVSLLVSGPLTVMGNRYGFITYYFQFPMRLAFQISLTFGFLTKVIAVKPGLYAGMLLATMFALEAIRLMHTIQTHRRM